MKQWISLGLICAACSGMWSMIEAQQDRRDLHSWLEQEQEYGGHYMDNQQDLQDMRKL